MTTQTYIADMQSLGSAAQGVKKIEAGYQVQSQASSTLQGAGKALPAHSLVQADQQYPSPLFTVSIGSDQNGSDQNGETGEGLQIQHPTGQIVYHAAQGYEYVQPAMYTTITGNYYDGSSAAAGQIVSHGGNSFVVQGGSIDGEGPGLAHTIRASPATVQWLVDNYETAEGVSLPRSTLYTHYMRHCQELRLDPMNPASFGKLIRSVFMGLRTRRLGTRGNSQYHYYGIRIKSMSPLNQFNNDQCLGSRQHPINPAKRFKSDPHQDAGSSAAESSPASQQSSAAGPGSVSSQQQHHSAQLEHQQFLGDHNSAIPEFGHVDLPPDQPLPNGITREHISTFELLYKDHCEAFLDIVVNLQFPLIETLWTSFWRTQSDSECDDEEPKLPKEKLYALCELPAVTQYMRRSDYAFYQALVTVLIPDVLRPIPSVLTQAIRNFGKNLEGWLRNALIGVPEIMIKTKVSAVGAFAQILRRYTSLNHLAQAARAVLQNIAQISQMLTDINKVDFTNIQEQASWVCQCDDGVIHKLEQDFKKTLQHQTSLEQWAAWLDGVVNQALSRYIDSPDFAKAARQFLLKWSFYSSMVIRDLTLRSAASFGSFHLIRLLYDEYMFYLVEHKVAAASGQTSIAVMGEVRQMADFETFSYNGDNGLAGGSMLPSERHGNGASNGVVLGMEGSVQAGGAVYDNNAPVSLSMTAATPTVVTLTHHQLSGAARPTISVVSNSASGQRVALVSAAHGAVPTSRTVVVLPASAISNTGGVSGGAVQPSTTVKIVRNE